MTGQALVTRAISLFGDTNRTFYEGLAIHAVNLLMAETFDVNNRIRVENRKSALSEVPELSSLSGEIPYEDRLVKYAFPYGMAAKLFADERDLALLGVFHQSYANAVNECDRGYVRFL